MIVVVSSALHGVTYEVQVDRIGLMHVTDHAGTSLIFGSIPRHRATEAGE
jgi:hypothetical protein